MFSPRIRFVSRKPWRTRVTTAMVAAGLLTGSATGLVACGGGTELLLIPLFEFGFTGTLSGTPIGVFFLPDTPTASSGNFDTVNMNVGPTQIRFNGSWRSCSFTLALKPGEAAVAPAVATYNGRFVGADSIELVPASGNAALAMTLKRQGAATRNTGC